MPTKLILVFWLGVALAACTTPLPKPFAAAQKSLGSAVSRAEALCRESRGATFSVKPSGGDPCASVGDMLKDRTGQAAVGQISRNAKEGMMVVDNQAHLALVSRLSFIAFTSQAAAMLSNLQSGVVTAELLEQEGGTHQGDYEIVVNSASEAFRARVTGADGQIEAVYLVEFIYPDQGMADPGGSIDPSFSTRQPWIAVTIEQVTADPSVPAERLAGEAMIAGKALQKSLWMKTGKTLPVSVTSNDPRVLQALGDPPQRTRWYDNPQAP